jgi:hypothetical protein
MIWINLTMLKTSPLWKKLDIDTRHDFLGTPTKTREDIATNRAKRIERRAKAKGITLTKDGIVG